MQAAGVRFRHLIPRMRADLFPKYHITSYKLTAIKSSPLQQTLYFHTNKPLTRRSEKAKYKQYQNSSNLYKRNDNSQSEGDTLYRAIVSYSTIDSAKSDMKSVLSIYNNEQTKTVEILNVAQDVQNVSTCTQTNQDSRTGVWKVQRPLSPKKLMFAYMDLSKDKLTAFVVLTAMSGFAIAPFACSIQTLFFLTAGTAMCSSAANSINQWAEVPYDAQMKRTRNRPIVRGALQPVNALSFGLGMGVLGTTSLLYFVNPLTATIGLSNILLYAFVYTPLKRISIVNTWVGAIVGALPPLMGWAAVTGDLDVGALILAGILFAWQFPHFNSLAWTLRKDYSVAGYRMMSVLNPALNSRVALRYSIAMFPLCWLMSYYQIVDYWFLLDSSIVNSHLLYTSFKFWQNSNSKSSRTLFFASLVNLPLILILLILHKKRHDSDTTEEASE